MFETAAGALPPPPPPPPQPAMISRVNNNPEDEDRLCFMDEVLDRAKTTVLSRVDSITLRNSPTDPAQVPADVAHQVFEPVRNVARGSGPVHAGNANSSIAFDDRPDDSNWPTAVIRRECISGHHPA